MTFSVLYNSDTQADIIVLLTHINDFTKNLGIEQVTIDPDGCMSVLRGMKQDFPHKDGRANASAFKQVANFVAFFVATRPILSPFPESIIGAELAQISNHQNAIVAFQIAIDSLHGAVIKRDDEISRLNKRIEVSNTRTST